MKTRTGKLWGCLSLAAVISINLAITAPAATHYVDLNSTNATPPYTDWTTAATNIQDAVDAATNGDLVLVTNGIYQTGGYPVNGNILTNRVAVTKPLTLQSVNGPAHTVIQGYQVPGTTNGDSAVRCAYLTNGVTLSGFTLANGATRALLNGARDGSGGGAWCESVNAVVTNCVIVGNASGYAGGGAYFGTLVGCMIGTNSVLGGRDWGGGAYNSSLANCTLVHNSAGEGGGAYSCNLNNCLLVGNTAGIGGGAIQCTLISCTIVGNSASSSGGGACGGTLNACSISNNTASNGGGTLNSTLNNCLVSGNSAGSGGGVDGGTITGCTVVSNSATSSGGGIYGSAYGYNSIVYYNLAPSGSNNIGTKFNNCCTLPNLYGGGITNEPLFVDLANGDFHLQSNSPCINSGNNIFVTVPNDLDGNPRIVGGTVDIGAYEYQTPSSVLSYAWAQQYGLPTDGTADYADTDGTGMNNWQKWIAGLNPTNPASLLAIQPPVATNTTTGVTVSWQSVNTRTYYLQRATDFTAQPAFTSIRSNLLGQAGTTSYTDTTATNGGPFFYRVGVQ